MTIEELVDCDDAKIEELLALTDEQREELFKQFAPIISLVRPAKKAPKTLAEKVKATPTVDPEKMAKRLQILKELGL
jgi:hypothetical protein